MPERKLATPERALRTAIVAGEDIGVVRRDWPQHTIWIGKREDLVATGICAARHFPVDRKRSIHGRADGRDGIEFWITELVLRGHFRHRVTWTDEACASRTRELAARTAAEASVDVPTAHELARTCEGSLRVERRMMAQMMTGELFGAASPRYDQATVEKITALLDHASQVLQAAMPARPRSVVRREKRAIAAKNDSAFRAFLAAALTAPERSQRKRPGAAP